MTTSPDHEDLELRQRLRALRVELPDDGFEAALHGRLLAAAAPRPPRLLARLHAAPWRGRLGTVDPLSRRKILHLLSRSRYRYFCRHGSQPARSLVKAHTG